MTLAAWLREHLIDHEKEREIDHREALTEARIRSLREHRDANGFGRLFDEAIHPKRRQDDS